MKRANIPGFSLVEIMVVVAIIGIVSLIALPSMIGWRTARQLDGVARNFMADMQLARLKAIREAEDVSVILNVVGDSYQMIVDLNKNYTFDVGETQFRNVTMPPGITINSTTFIGDKTRFNPRGRPNIIGRATFQSTSGAICEVFLSRAGRLRIQ